MKKEEFIEKWLVGYEDLEQKAEFSKEMMQDLESLTEPTQLKGLDLKDLEKRLDEALAKETPESLNEWLKKFREKNPLPTQEVVVSAEECLENVFRNTKFRPRYFEKESGVYYHKEIVLQAMHTYASQTREEELKKHAVGFGVSVSHNKIYKTSNPNGFKWFIEGLENKIFSDLNESIEYLYQEYLNRK